MRYSLGEMGQHSIGDLQSLGDTRYHLETGWEQWLPVPPAQELPASRSYKPGEEVQLDYGRSRGGETILSLSSDGLEATRVGQVSVLPATHLLRAPACLSCSQKVTPVSVYQSLSLQSLVLMILSLSLFCVLFLCVFSSLPTGFPLSFLPLCLFLFPVSFPFIPLTYTGNCS